MGNISHTILCWNIVRLHAQNSICNKSIIFWLHRGSRIFLCHYVSKRANNFFLPWLFNISFKYITKNVKVLVLTFLSFKVKILLLLHILYFFYSRQIQFSGVISNVHDCSRYLRQLAYDLFNLFMTVHIYG